MRAVANQVNQLFLLILHILIDFPGIASLHA
jgi:hypothetical protein